jgi:hypothetical protein
VPLHSLKSSNGSWAHQQKRACLSNQCQLQRLVTLLVQFSVQQPAAWSMEGSQPAPFPPLLFKKGSLTSLQNRFLHGLQGAAIHQIARKYARGAPSGLLYAMPCVPTMCCMHVLHRHICVCACDVLRATCVRWRMCLELGCLEMWMNHILLLDSCRCGSILHE